MTNLIDAIRPYLNEACLERLTEASAIRAWYDSINFEGDEGHLEIAARYSASGHPVTFTFPVLNAAAIKAACEAEADEIPEPVYQF